MIDLVRIGLKPHWNHIAMRHNNVSLKMAWIFREILLTKVICLLILLEVSISGKIFPHQAQWALLSRKICTKNQNFKKMGRNHALNFFVFYWQTKSKIRRPYNLGPYKVIFLYKLQKVSWFNLKNSASTRPHNSFDNVFV